MRAVLSVFICEMVSETIFLMLEPSRETNSRETISFRLREKMNESEPRVLRPPPRFVMFWCLRFLAASQSRWLKCSICSSVPLNWNRRSIWCEPMIAIHERNHSWRRVEPRDPIDRRAMTSLDFEEFQHLPFEFASEKDLIICTAINLQRSHAALRAQNGLKMSPNLLIYACRKFAEHPETPTEAQQTFFHPWKRNEHVERWMRNKGIFRLE